MKQNLVNVVLLLSALLLSACSGTSTMSSNSACYTQSCNQHYDSKPVTQNFGGSNLGSSFREYGTNMLHD
ncbi:hypothetical protein [Pseudomonas sp. FEN]|uniref:hypothetical protein n=1 Tax=Pseudomonas sp. FEN TaxID=2767468 RepID=UPI00174DA77A|nr:hypothetical protein [Pseudomonas sp. FEN]